MEEQKGMYQMNTDLIYLEDNTGKNGKPGLSMSGLFLSDLPIRYITQAPLAQIE